MSAASACSLVSELKGRGYECLAMHPYYESGWMRNTVWPGLGFDECLFLDDFPRENLVRSFVSDQEMFEKIVERYETRDPEKPLFIWGVTMQNHGGYTYGGSDFVPTHHAGGTGKRVSHRRAVSHGHP